MAQKYRSDRPFPAHAYFFVSGTLNRIIHYNHVLDAGVEEEGLHLRVFLLPPGHPTLFIPYSDIEFEKASGWFRRRMYFGHPRIASFSLSKKLASEIEKRQKKS